MATSDKYDRQLRLWGPSGQKALSRSTVVLINATSAGTEALKNLVLPGIGSFHVIDDATVGGPSHRPFHNFFVFPDNDNDGGEVKVQTRAETASRHLSELNPDVRGSHAHVSSLADSDFSALLSSAPPPSKGGKLLVIAADLSPHPLLNLSEVCDRANIPFLIVRSYGLVGIVRVQVPYHPIVESRPDNSVPDLRLASAKMFPALQRLVDETELDALNSAEHRHIPYVVLLVKAIAQWREAQMDDNDEKSKGLNCLPRLPQTLEEKNAFRETIKSMSKDFHNEVNFEEAYSDAYLAYSTADLPWEVQQILDGAEKQLERRKSDENIVKFNILALALKRFMDRNDGQRPVEGPIPDMTASTDRYVALQAVYKSKAEQDAKAMKTIVDEIRTEKADGLGKSPEVPEEDVKIFCKNARNLRVLKTRSYADEYKSQTRLIHSPTCVPPPEAEDAMEIPTCVPPPEEEDAMDMDEQLPSSAALSAIEEEIKDDLLMATMDPYEIPDQKPLLYHIALRACDVFQTEHGSFPGASDSRKLALQSDVNQVQKYVEAIVLAMGLEETDLMKTTLLSKSEKHAKELVRYGNSEIHNVASVVGGVAGQEAVKLITGQHVPLDNTYLFNGVAGIGAVYRF